MIFLKKYSYFNFNKAKPPFLLLFFFFFGSIIDHIIHNKCIGDHNLT